MKTCAIAFLMLFLTGCAASVVNYALKPLDHSLQRQTDLRLLHDGAPSLLLVIDGLISSSPENHELLLTGVRAYSSYAALASAFDNAERAGEMSRKAREYGITLLAGLPGLAAISQQTAAEIAPVLAALKKNSVPRLFWGGFGLATWIQYQEGAPAAMIQLPKVEQIMLRVTELDEGYYYGAAHLFLGALYGSKPLLLGGRPEESRRHFEKALALADRGFLMGQVTYANIYARNSFDRALFSSLLHEVMEHPLEDNELAASNQLAKTLARTLLEQEDDIF